LKASRTKSVKSMPRLINQISPLQ